LGVFDEEAEVSLGDEIGRTEVRAPVEADAVAEGHLGEGGGEAGRADVVEREEFSVGVELVELFGDLLELREIRKLVGIAGNLDE
jgi:hypothetical protein